MLGSACFVLGPAKLLTRKAGVMWPGVNPAFSGATLELAVTSFTLLITTERYTSVSGLSDGVRVERVQW